MGATTSMILSGGLIGGGAITGQLMGGNAMGGALAGGLIAKPLTSLLGSIDEAKKAKKWAKFERTQAKADATANLGAARVQANLIRERAKSQAKSMASNVASSGVVVGSGTDDQITRDILEGGSYDAQMTMFNAQDEFARAMQGVSINKLRTKEDQDQRKMGMFENLLGLGAAGIAGFGAFKKMKAEADAKKAGNATPSIGKLNATSGAVAK